MKMNWECLQNHIANYT